jgi:hypothetical protein
MPTCPAHAAEELIGPCERCGDFVCKLDSRVLEGKRLCVARCAAEVESDYLERYRRELWGKMDGWVFWFGILSPFFTLIGIWWAPPLEAAVGIGGTAIFIAYLLRKPWARVALFLMPPTHILLSIPQGGEAVGAAFAVSLFTTLLVTGAYLSPRNRLAFRLTVSRAQLRKLWDVYRNNPRARESVALGILGWPLPILAPVGVAMAIYGLLQVNPASDPPIGKRSHAMAGLLLSIASIIFWATALILGWIR